MGLDEAWQRLSGGQPLTVESAVAAVTAVKRDLDAGGPGVAGPGVAGPGRADADDLLAAVALLGWAQAELAALEPALVGAARAAGVSWQRLAPAMGVSSRQAAERRYLRSVPDEPGTAQAAPGGTKEDRVTAERDRRAGQRAVDAWADAHTADLRGLAGRITGLSDLGDGAADDISGLHRALAGAGAADLPGLLARSHRHLGEHPELAAEVDAVTEDTERVRRSTQSRRERDR